MLRLVSQGYSNKEIAAQLDLSVKTIEVHKANGMRSSLSAGESSSCDTPSIKVGCTMRESIDDCRPVRRSFILGQALMATGRLPQLHRAWLQKTKTAALTIC